MQYDTLIFPSHDGQSPRTLQLKATSTYSVCCQSRAARFRPSQPAPRRYDPGRSRRRGRSAARRRWASPARNMGPAPMCLVLRSSAERDLQRGPGPRLLQALARIGAPGAPASLPPELATPKEEPWLAKAAQAASRAVPAGCR